MATCNGAWRGQVASSLRMPGFGGSSAEVNTECVVVVGMSFSRAVRKHLMGWAVRGFDVWMPMPMARLEAREARATAVCQTRKGVRWAQEAECRGTQIDGSRNVAGTARLPSLTEWQGGYPPMGGVSSWGCWTSGSYQMLGRCAGEKQGEDGCKWQFEQGSAWLGTPTRVLQINAGKTARTRLCGFKRRRVGSCGCLGDSIPLSVVGGCSVLSCAVFPRAVCGVQARSGQSEVVEWAACVRLKCRGNAEVEIPCFESCYFFPSR